MSSFRRLIGAAPLRRQHLAFPFAALVLVLSTTTPPADAQVTPARPVLPYYCDMPYAIDASALVADFDVNCNFTTSGGPNYYLPTANVTGYPWYSRVGSAPPGVISFPPAQITSRVVYDGDRKLYTLDLAANSKVYIPVDISPSVMPNVSIEFCAQVKSYDKGGPAAASIAATHTRQIWSTGTRGLFTGENNPRAFSACKLHCKRAAPTSPPRPPALHGFSGVSPTLQYICIGTATHRLCLNASRRHHSHRAPQMRTLTLALSSRMHTWRCLGRAGTPPPS